MDISGMASKYIDWFFGYICTTVLHFLFLCGLIFVIYPKDWMGVSVMVFISLISGLPMGVAILASFFVERVEAPPSLEEIAKSSIKESAPFMIYMLIIGVVAVLIATCLTVFCAQKFNEARLFALMWTLIFGHFEVSQLWAKRKRKKPEVA